MIHILKPFDRGKNLGAAYNRAMSMIGEDDWGCLMDLDTMFLTPDAGNILEDYTKLYPYAGMFTCRTNRIHPLAYHQLYEGGISSNDSVKHHIEIAKSLSHKRTASNITKVCSGFLMMISKKTWNEIKFTEDKKCLGVDNDYCDRLFKNHKAILLMDGLYVWHTYRLAGGINDKQHLY